jgi:hypothetical protein
MTKALCEPIAAGRLMKDRAHWFYLPTLFVVDDHIAAVCFLQNDHALAALPE